LRAIDDGLGEEEATGAEAAGVDTGRAAGAATGATGGRMSEEEGEEDDVVLV